MNELGRLAQNGEIEFDWEVTTLEGILKVHPKYLYKYYIVTDGGRNIALNETLSRVEYSKLRGIKPGTQIRVRGRPGTFLHEGSTEGNPSPFGRTWVVYMKVKEVERTN